jgi:hypothetical protein
MNNVKALLFSHELEALLEALRRDHRSEADKACSDPVEAEWHQRNARMSLRILEVLKPRNRSVSWRQSSTAPRKEG